MGVKTQRKRERGGKNELNNVCVRLHVQTHVKDRGSVAEIMFKVWAYAEM